MSYIIGVQTKENCHLNFYTKTKNKQLNRLWYLTIIVPHEFKSKKKAKRVMKKLNKWLKEDGYSVEYLGIFSTGKKEKLSLVKKGAGR